MEKMVKIKLLAYEPVDFESKLRVLENSIDFGDVDFATDMAQTLAYELGLTPRNKPLLFSLSNAEFCVGIIKIARKVLIASNL